jgi:hypothetical protein
MLRWEGLAADASARLQLGEPAAKAAAAAAAAAP